ncbi:hypothetical protein BFRIG_03673 [Peribacillus frigoritolerans]|uniref:O-unit flippase-like protein n=1 Tax=Peribacillus frigoritolerans TaxID=450367 RepID=UPI0030D0452C
MIKTNKRDIIVSYIDYFLKLASNIIVLPIVLRMLPPSEYGLWVVFLSIGSLVFLTDLGFNMVIVRNITYAYSGAKILKKSGKPVMQASQGPNYKLLFQVFNVAKKIYLRISLFAAAFIGVLSFHIIFISKNDVDIQKSLLAWFIYGLSLFFSLLFNNYTCMVKGLGRIKESAMIGIKNRIVYLIIQVLFLSFGWGIIGLALSNLLVNLLYRVQIKRLIKDLFTLHTLEYQQALQTNNEEIKNIYNSISSNSKGMGIIMVVNYIQSQGMILIVSVFLSLSTIASLGLVIQLISIVGTLAVVPFSTYMAKLNQLKLNNQIEKLKDLFSFINIFLHFTFIMGTFIILIFGDFLMSVIGSNTVLLPNVQILLIILYFWILANHQRSTSFIALSNQQPFVKAYSISCIVSLLIGIISLYFTHNIYGIIIPNLFVQCAYNAWKWPLESYKLVNLKFSEILSRTFKQVKRYKYS